MNMLTNIHHCLNYFRCKTCHYAMVANLKGRLGKRLILVNLLHDLSREFSTTPRFRDHLSTQDIRKSEKLELNHKGTGESKGLYVYYKEI